MLLGLGVQVSRECLPWSRGPALWVGSAVPACRATLDWVGGVVGTL